MLVTKERFNELVCGYINEYNYIKVESGKAYMSKKEKQTIPDDFYPLLKCKENYDLPDGTYMIGQLLRDINRVKEKRLCFSSWQLAEIHKYLREKKAMYDAVFDYDEINQIIVYNETHRIFDIVCSKGSYGGKVGLLEIAGEIVDRKKDGNTVVGCLTAEQVIERIEKLCLKS